MTTVDLSPSDLFDQVEAQPEPVVVAPEPDPATPRQIAYLRDLAAKRVLSPEHEARLAAALPTMDKALASRSIDWLRSQPERPRSQQPVQEMPEAGYYAVTWRGVLRFYVVREGTGPWAGRRFLNRFRSDYQDRPGRAERAEVIALIQAAPGEARLRFAQETVCCYVCGRRLTDPESRELGIGPVCRKEADY